MRLLTTAIALVILTANTAHAQFIALSPDRPLPTAARTLVSGNFTNARVEDALHELARQGNLALSYRPDLPSLNNRVSMGFDRLPVGTAIMRLLTTTQLEAAMKSTGSTVLLRMRTIGAMPMPSPTGITMEEMTANAPIPIAEVVVTPGHFGVAHEKPTQTQTISREQIETLPQLAEDIYRTVNRLPGMVSNEMSAKLTVRGGNDESLLVTLDGVELYEPYHLKDFDAALSIIDVASIGGVDVATGGLSAESGNRLTGAFDMRTTNAMPTKPRTTLGISLSNARIMSQGAFANGKGLWLMSARRGYIDILLHWVDTDAQLDPRYYDVQSKIVYQFSPNHRLSLHALRAGDTGSFLDDDGDGELHSNYGSTYAWAVWDAALTPSLQMKTTLSTAALNWHRSAIEQLRSDPYDVRDTRDFNATAFRQDWRLGGERWQLRWGGEFKTGNAEYDYYRRQTRARVQSGGIVTALDSIDLTLNPTGNTIGGYLSQRFRPWSRLTVEAGVRVDHQSHTDETETSPRVNAAFGAGNRTTFRAAWGRYAQPQQLFQLHVQDGEFAFLKSERAEQIEIGIERRMGYGITGRAQLYRRNESNLRTRYQNIENSVEPLAEAEADRMVFNPSSGRAQGVEVMFQRNADKHSWSVSYALAEAYDVVNGRNMPRPLEQRHTFYSDYSYAPAPGWRVSAAWQFHSGWPTTFAQFRADHLADGSWWVTRYWGAAWNDRLPGYQRVDLRATRRFALKGGQMTVFADIFNVLNHENPQRYNYSVNFNNLGNTFVTKEVESLLPRLPTIGVTWEF